MMYVSANEKAVSLNLHRYITEVIGQLAITAFANTPDALLDPMTDCAKMVAVKKLVEVGQCTLTPPDPQLKGAWYPGGFNTCIIE
jgi:hypothetical protein